jgi:hypothetical protein
VRAADEGDVLALMNAPWIVERMHASVGRPDHH